MIQRLADYVADFMVAHDITNCFTVVGGGAMHLNDAFGHHPQIKSTYHHHEQGAAIAAESYARQLEKPALLCVTTGPGGTNALTGVVGAWLDSIPMMVISGQVSKNNASKSGRPIYPAFVKTLEKIKTFFWASGARRNTRLPTA